MATKFSELHPTRLYPFPLEDATRDHTQKDHKLRSQELNKQALLDQMRYNKIKRRMDKESDMNVGNMMILNAQESLKGETQFKQLQRLQTGEALRKNWQ